MASPAEVIYERLANNGASALVGTRIYPKRAPHGVSMPLVVYEQVSGVREQDHDGGGLARPRFTVKSYARNYRQTKALAALVRADLDDFKGTVLGLEIQHITIANELDLPFEDDAGAYGVAQDFIIWHTE